MTVQVRGVECSDLTEALQTADTDGGCVIRVGGKYLVVDQSEGDRLEAARVPFAYVTCRDGVTMTVPVN